MHRHSPSFSCMMIIIMIMPTAGCGHVPNLLKSLYEKCVYLPTYLSTYLCFSIQTDKCEELLKW